MLIATLWAQTGGIPEGPAGWVAMAGTLGLLGPVLYWLCYSHLPAKDQQIKDLVKDKDQQIKDLIESKDQAIADKDAQIRALIEVKDKALGDKDALILGLIKNERDAVTAIATVHKETVREVAAHCEREVEKLSGHWQRELSNLTLAVQDLSQKIDEMPTRMHT